MESARTSFLDLPAEIRNEIYAISHDWNDINVQICRLMDTWDGRTMPPPYPQQSSPTVLLLNRQIYKEASSIVYNKPFNLILSPHHKMQTQAEIPDIMRFVTSNTLQKVEHICITIDSWEWIHGLHRFLPALAAKHNLKTFSLGFKDNLKTTFLKDPSQRYPDDTLHSSLSALATIRGVAKVSFTGDLPDVYTAPLIRIMQSPTTETNLPTLQAIRGDGTADDIDD